MASSLTSAYFFLILQKMPSYVIADSPVLSSGALPRSSKPVLCFFLVQSSQTAQSQEW